MSNHTDIRKQLPPYCGGDLNPAERMRVEEHLAGCAPCRAELADLQTALRLIRTTPESEPPPWLATRVMARVREQRQQKRSWLQRLFFPLHIKLPLEVAALLMVCVSGYYLARTVETELQQPASQQELPAAARDMGKEIPAAEPARPAEKNALTPETTMPAMPSAPGVTDRIAPQPVPAPPGKASPRPAFAPAPPAMKEERLAPAAEAPSGTIQPLQTIPGGYAPKRAKKGEAQKEMDSGSSGYNKAQSESARGASVTATGTAVPALRIRLVIADPVSAPELLREAVTRSGGSVMDERSVRPNTLKARIPPRRMGELLESLARLGTVVERPPANDVSGMVEIEIIW